MSQKTVIFGSLAGAVLLFILIYVLTSFSYKRNEVGLRTQAEAQQRVVEIAHDKMWKVLAQKAGISQQYRPADYKELLAEVVEGRKGGSFAKMVTEQNPSFDLSLLKDLSQSVEAEHAVVVREEKLLLDVARQHKALILDPLGEWFLSGRQPIQVSVISSTRSKNAVESGVDDEVDLFPSK